MLFVEGLETWFLWINIDDESYLFFHKLKCMLMVRNLETFFWFRGSNVILEAVFIL